MRRGSIALLVVGLAGCSSPQAAQPTATPSSPSQTAATETQPVASQTAAPTEPAVTTEPVATPTVYTEVQKNAEGGHGGPHPIDLPAAVVVDYSVTGTCTFEASFEPADMTPASQSMSIKVDGTTTGSWNVELTPGSYLVQLGEAVGCTFLVTVRSPG